MVCLGKNGVVCMCGVGDAKFAQTELAIGVRKLRDGMGVGTSAGGEREEVVCSCRYRGDSRKKGSAESL
jgi:hypothetical protein